ncbi:hypothetical protein DRQ50_02905 [bacterium]|nr:MAG: hypothetical protein DRQ50_02905 [bacterium]
MKLFGKILIVALATLVAGTAFGQCPQSAISTGLGSPNNVILVNDGTSSVLYAQAFTVECSSQFLNVEFALGLQDPIELNGVPSLATGDYLRAYLMDDSRNVIGWTDHQLSFQNGSEYINFDLSGRTFEVGPGDYHVAVEALSEGWGRIYTANGLGVVGSMWTDTGSGWTEDATDDLMIRIYWDQNGVPNDNLAWGAMKASYR